MVVFDGALQGSMVGRRRVFQEKGIATAFRVGVWFLQEW
jgi:hypothetical protein